jgi:hypothetical protein
MPLHRCLHVSQIEQHRDGLDVLATQGESKVGRSGLGGLRAGDRRGPSMGMM